MSNLINEIQRKYRVTVYNIDENALGYKLETNRGNMFLRSLPGGYISKEPFVDQVYNKMGKSRQLLPFIPSVDGERIVSIQDTPYYMTAWPQDESELVDYSLLGNAMASFHRKSQAKLGVMNSNYNHAGQWLRSWNQRVGQLDWYRRAAMKRVETGEATDFDHFFVDNFDHIHFLGANSIPYLGNSNYQQIVGGTQQFGVLGHSDFGFDSFATTPNGKVYFVDPFSWVEDIRARDIAQFIKSDVREYGWNPYHIHAFLTGYHNKSPLLPEEFPVMYSHFLFPERIMKHLEATNPQPRLKLPFFNTTENEMRSDQGEEYYPAVMAYQDLQRNEVLLREFPRFMRHSFGVDIPTII